MKIRIDSWHYKLNCSLERKPSTKKPSLFKEFYKAHKDKFCPLIEVEKQ